MNAPQLLHNLGQSLWLDNISRDLLDNGTVERYIEQYSVTGLTSSPATFNHAMKKSPAYDAHIRERMLSGKSSEDLFFEVVLDDLTRAATLLRQVYERTSQVDGWVSLEVSPLLAHDTLGAWSAIKELHARASVPNLMIKVPGTSRAYPSISLFCSHANSISAPPRCSCAGWSVASRLDSTPASVRLRLSPSPAGTRQSCSRCRPRYGAASE
jgi:transaldolase